ncbi:unnamed protein product [Heterobilharzia americana]|nr:unnamed protein product [Heterobilharzia americana]
MSCLPVSMAICNTFTRCSDSRNLNNSTPFPSQYNRLCNLNTNELTNSYITGTDFHLITDRNQQCPSEKQNVSTIHYSVSSNTSLSPLYQLNNVFNQVNPGEFNSMFYSPYLQNSSSLSYPPTGHDISTTNDLHNSNLFTNLTQSLNQSFIQPTTNVTLVSSSSSSSCNTTVLSTTVHISNLCNTTNSSINNVNISFPMISTNTSVNLSAT